MTSVAPRGHIQLSSTVSRLRSTVSCLRSACRPGPVPAARVARCAGHDDPAHLSQWGDEVPPERQPGGKYRAAVGVVFWLTRDVGQASEVRRGYPRPYLPVRGLISPDQPHVAVPGRCPAQHDLRGGCGGLIGGNPLCGDFVRGHLPWGTRPAGRSSVRSVTAPGSGAGTAGTSIPSENRRAPSGVR